MCPLGFVRGRLAFAFGVNNNGLEGTMSELRSIKATVMAAAAKKKSAAKKKPAGKKKAAKKKSKKRK